jgi:two-component system phosphate regulon sensor histidine kinase PhoR
LSLLVDALLSYPSPGGDLQAIGDRMLDQVNTLGSIADGLIEISRLESGRALFRLERHRLAELVSHATSSLAPQMEDSRVRVNSLIEPGVVVLADEPQILRALTNLIDNARRFSPPGGVITVGNCDAAEVDRVEVFVSDEGPGIPPADIERIFERFYRGDSARAGEGKGLGLAVTRHIITGHGGAIWVDQSLTDHGTTIRFTLPTST